MKNRTHMIDYRDWQIEAVDEVKTVRSYEARNGKQTVILEAPTMDSLMTLIDLREGKHGES